MSMLKVLLDKDIARAESGWYLITDPTVMIRVLSDKRNHVKEIKFAYSLGMFTGTSLSVIKWVENNLDLLECIPRFTFHPRDEEKSAPSYALLYKQVFAHIRKLDDTLQRKGRKYGVDKLCDSQKRHSEDTSGGTGMSRFARGGEDIHWPSTDANPS